MVLLGCVGAFGCTQPSNPVNGDATTVDGAVADGSVGSADASTDAPIDAPGDAPVDAPVDAPGDAPTDGPITPIEDPPDPASPPCSGTLGFPDRPAIMASNGVSEFAYQDVDRDGNADVAMSTGYLEIAPGNANGTFEPITQTYVGASWLGLADVNGDGPIDLVTGYYSIEVVPGKPGGGFGRAQTYSLGSVRIAQGAVVDVDDDARADIVVLLSTSAGERIEVAVLRNTGTSFSAPVRTSVGPDQQQFALADLDGDRRPELVTTDPAGKVKVFRNTGNGAFATAVEFPSPSPAGIAIVDFDQDGKLDLVLGSQNTAGTQISVLRGQGNRVFGAATSFPAGPGTAPRSLSVADVDGDGRLDVGIAEPSTAVPRILRGTGSGQLGPPLELEARATGILLRDIDRDGRVDMLLNAQFGVTQHINNGTASLFEMRSTQLFGTLGGGPVFLTMRLVDVDGDGRLDWIFAGGAVVESDSYRATLETRRQTSNGGWGPATVVRTSFLGFETFMADMNNDGRQDAVLQGYCADQCANGAIDGIQTMLSNGDGTWTAATSRAVPWLAGHRVVADVNGDGKRDLVIGELGVYPNYAATVRYYPGLGNGDFGPGIPVWTGAHVNGLVAADLNRDGKLDLAIASNQASLEVLLGLGAGLFGPPTANGTFPPKRSLYARDLDEDGILDLIGFRDQYLVVMHGLGDGTFSTDPILSTAPVDTWGSWADPPIEAFADFNGDGHLDLAVPTDSTAGISLGRGDGTFAEPLHFETGAGINVAGTLAVGDVDRDGRLDLFAHVEGDAASLLLGRCFP